MAVEAQNIKVHHTDSMLNFRGMDLGRGAGGPGGPAGAAGGGRRKQSKPIRVFMDMMPGEAEMMRPSEALEAATGMPELTDPRTQEKDMEVDDMFSCDLCNDSFLTQSALTEHIQQMHDVGNPANDSASYPTKYHQLGSEFQQEIGVAGEDLAKSAASQNNGVEEPDTNTSHSADSAHNANSQGEIDSPGGKNGKSRIFHPDAFCKMCDREFCNRYFLKTHMANKHGIYEPGGSPESGSPKLMNTDSNGSNNNAPSFAETLAMLPSVTGNSFSAFGPPLPLPSQADSQPGTPKTSAPPPLLPPTMPNLPSSAGLKLPKSSSSLPKQGSPPLSNTPTKSSSSSSSASKPTSKDMEDYCEICQKHFCNKYYLKKHKQDVHGIIPDPSSASSTKRGRPNPVSSNSCSPLTDVISTAPGPLAPLPPGLDAMPGGVPPGLSNVMFINPFTAPFALLQSQSSVLQQAAAAAGFPPGLPLPTPPPPPSESPKSSNASNVSPGSQAATPAAPTSNGQTSSNSERNPLNPEAYCDLCRKEFCNIHFLKIHKANKHGVFYEDLPNIIQQASLSQLPVLNVPSVPPSSQADNPGVIQIAPTAQEAGVKIKAEKPDTAHGDDRSRDSLLPPLPPSTSPLKPEQCTVCKKEYDNKYSLQIHMINAHNMKPADLDVMLGMAEPKSEHMLQGTMFSNMIAAKLADRVMCDICNKEVCNKYFLKTHKLKVHGVDTTNEREKDLKPPPTVIKPPQINKEPIPPPKESSPLKQPTTPTKVEGPLPPRPNDEELLKMGIDPEAYCEICKKEFCSKYFLKTHRANIHGIKSSSGSSSPDKNEKPLFSSSHKPSLPSHPLLPFPNLDGKDLPGFPGLPGLPVSLAQSLTSLGGGQHPLNLPPLPSQSPILPNFHPDNWPWKDQLTAQRVRCDICNKDLCNRYFLKTHMINKHNMNYDPITGTTTPMPPSQCGENGSSNGDMQPENLSLKSEERRDDMEDSSDSKISAKTWHVPPLGEEKNDSSNNNNKENMPAEEAQQFGGIMKCELCGMIFGEKVTLQLHMIQAHQGQVTVSTGNPTSSTSGATQLITFNLKKKYERGRRNKGMRLRRFGPSVGGAIGEKVRSAIVNHIASHQKSKKKFRCAHCQERFLSKPLCQAHIRQHHPNVRAKSGSPLANNNQGEAMDSTPTSSHLMQSFNLQEQGAERFASSVVQLPVFSKISEPVSVTFTLTPM